MKALVIGGAECVWKEIELATKLFKPDVVVAANDIAINLPAVDHWCTMHPEKMNRWLEARRKNDYHDPVLWTAAHRKRHFNLPFKQIPHTGGSSGLLAVNVARFRAKATRIVACGIPMTTDGGHFVRGVPWTASQHYRKAWNDQAAELAKCLRSFSGWTAETFGLPTAEWLSEEGPVDLIEGDGHQAP